MVVLRSYGLIRRFPNWIISIHSMITRYHVDNSCQLLARCFPLVYICRWFIARNCYTVRICLTKSYYHYSQTRNCIFYSGWAKDSPLNPSIPLLIGRFTKGKRTSSWLFSVLGWSPLYLVVFGLYLVVSLDTWLIPFILGLFPLYLVYSLYTWFIPFILGC